MYREEGSCSFSKRRKGTETGCAVSSQHVRVSVKNNVSIPCLKMNHRKAIHKGQNIEATILVSKVTEQPLFVKL